jgi:hypothetical protein
MASSTIYFIGIEHPANPEKNAVDYSTAFFTSRLAIEHARKVATEKYGANAVLRAFAEDKLGVFIQVGDDLALLCAYTLKSGSLVK